MYRCRAVILAAAVSLSIGFPNAGSVPGMSDIADLVAGWPVERVAVGVTTGSGTLATSGDTSWVVRVASVSKILTGYAGLVAMEEKTIDLDEPAGPEGSTVRHLMSHASGLAFGEHRPLARPGVRRIYSNAGIEVFAEHLARNAGIRFEEYVHLGLVEPLGMEATTLMGSPAHSVHSCVDDLLAFARELLDPTLVARSTLDLATSVHFPELRGVVPGVGRFDPNPWGLTFEIRGDKEPHWTGRANSPQTFGHFGGSGTFLWVDPISELACVVLTDREFGPWALEVWPALGDAVIERYAGFTTEGRTTS